MARMKQLHAIKTVGFFRAAVHHSQKLKAPISIFTICSTLIANKLTHAEFSPGRISVDFTAEIFRFNEAAMPAPGYSRASENEMEEELRKLGLPGIDTNMHEIYASLLSHNIVTTDQVRNMASDRYVTDTLRRLYKDHLKRDYDASAFAAWGSLLFIFENNPEIVRFIETAILRSSELQSSECKQRHCQ
jgi:hypothetical protein